MKVIIIEDEAAACSNMKKILEEIDPAIDILGCFDTVAGSVLWLRSHPMPDLIFMDIQLADGTSFNIFECVNVDAPVIFTTAYDEYAIDAFRVNSIDYILKPVTSESVRRAIDKHNRVKQLGLQNMICSIDNALRRNEYPGRILVPVKDKIISVSTGEIAFFYNTNGMTEAALINNTKYRIDKSLDSVYERLDPARFIRANRQFIISKNAIRDITIWFDSRLLVNMTVEVPEKIYVSKNRAAEFKEWFAL